MESFRARSAATMTPPPRRAAMSRAPRLDRLAEGHRRLRRLRLPRRRAIPGDRVDRLERRAQPRPQRRGRLLLPVRHAPHVPADRRHRLALAGAAVAVRLRARPGSAAFHSAGGRHPGSHAAAVVAGRRHRPRRREPAEHDRLVLRRHALRTDAALVRRLRHAPVVHRLPAGLLDPVPAAARRAAAPRPARAC